MNKLLKKVSTIHWFDWLMIAIALAIVASFFFFFYRRTEYINIRVKVTDQEVLTAYNVPTDVYARQFHVGDVERDAVGRVVTEITGVESYPITKENTAVYLDLRVRATYDTRTKLYSARGKSLMFGTPMRFNLSNVAFDGYVTETPQTIEVKSQEKKLNVTVLARGVEPAVVNMIKVGDAVINSQGKVLVKITKLRVEPALEVTANDRGDLLTSRNPIFKDVIMDLELTVRELENKDLVMFDDVTVGVGVAVPMRTKYYTTYPFITSIEGIK